METTTRVTYPVIVTLHTPNCGLLRFFGMDNAMEAMYYYHVRGHAPKVEFTCQNKTWSFVGWVRYDWAETACEFHNQYERAKYNGAPVYAKENESHAES